jgi:ribonuclease HI
VRLHPAWKSIFRIQIAGKTEEAIKIDRNDKTLMHVYTDGSDYEGGVGAVVALWISGREIHALVTRLGMPSEHTVFEAELVGIVLALHIIMKQEEVGTVVIGVDNQAVIRVMQNLTSGSGQYIIDEVHEIAMSRVWEGK